ncbi:ROK family protein [Nocardia sp. alder85J]|uniref:ROK family protein n=1 Tax=Nocardia sp. alder85J TaxID=2862949 RepID=UPI001CD5D986|nr:ROK family protein [Nocardia sp. alder85J]MCX4098587.1 ROK family protein [Nocardia sp. alder85J]
MTTSPAPVHLQQMRRANLQSLLLSLIAAPGSRADLAQRTGLTKATVSSLVEPLLHQRILVETEAQVAGRGRPSRPLRFHPDAPVAAGAEINVSHLAVTVRSLDGRVHAYQRVQADNRRRGADDIVAATADLVRATVPVDARLLGVGLAVPGIVHDATITRAPNVPALAGERAGDHLAALLGVTDVAVDNEANLAAFAHLWPQRMAGPDFAYVSGDVGVGSGLVLRGELFRGATGFAGELGHVVIDRDGRPCNCGGRGCLEQYAGLDTILGAAGRRTVGSLVRALAHGDSRARGAVADAGAALGVGLSSLLNIVDVSSVVLGGSYALLAEHLEPPIRAELDTRVLSAQHRGITVGPSPVGPDAVTGGAAGLITHLACMEPQRLEHFIDEQAVPDAARSAG